MRLGPEYGSGARATGRTSKCDRARILFLRPGGLFGSRRVTLYVWPEHNYRWRIYLSLSNPMGICADSSRRGAEGISERQPG
jgi:hypothetical protein